MRNIIRRVGVFVAVLAFPLAANAIEMIHCRGAGSSQYLAQNNEADPTIDTANDEVQLTYVGGSTFLIETAKGTLAATDFVGNLGAGQIPDLVTINRVLAQDLTQPTDPRIARVMPDSDGRLPNGYFMEVGQMLVLNLPAGLRGSVGRIESDNSIFVFETAGLCIAQFGQLNREPSADEYAALGKLDVVMVPVEQGRTLDLATTLRMLTRLQTKVVLPMNWSEPAVLDEFVDGLSAGFAADVRSENTTVVSQQSLPELPVVTVLLAPDQAAGA